MGARLVDWGVGLALVGINDIIRQQPGFDFFAADVGKHCAIDLDAGAEHLTAFFDHLLTLGRIVDNVAIFVRQVVFAQHGAHALAPATRWFQIGDNFRFIHSSKVMNKVT